MTIAYIDNYGNVSTLDFSGCSEVLRRTCISRVGEKPPFWGTDGCWKYGLNGHIGRNCPAPKTQQVRTNALDVDHEFSGAAGGGQGFTRPQTKEEWMALLPEVKQKV